MVCGDFEFFQRSSVCGPRVVVCRDFEFFKVPRVCGLCVVVCGDFEFFQSFSVLGPCVVVGDFVFSSPPVCDHLVNLCIV